MSTNATIAIRNSDGDFDAIYLHWDGHPNIAGKTLLQNYTLLEQARELIALGDLSTLRGETDKCEAYYRDKGEEWDDVRPTKLSSLREVIDYNSSAEFLYIWIAENSDEPAAGPGRWSAWNGRGTASINIEGETIA